jgi:hypothetical protein
MHDAANPVALRVITGPPWRAVWLKKLAADHDIACPDSLLDQIGNAADFSALPRAGSLSRLIWR